MNQGNWEIMKALEAERDALKLQNRELQNAVDRANAAMLKHQKHNGALEIAIQEAHRDTDAALRLNGALKDQLDAALDAGKRALDGADRLRAGLEWIKVNGDEASRIMADDVLKAQEKRICEHGDYQDSPIDSLCIKCGGWYRLKTTR